MYQLESYCPSDTIIVNNLSSLDRLIKENKLCKKVNAQWENENQIYVICIEKQGSLQQIQAIIQKLETQLGNENLSLLEKQQLMDETLKKMEQVVMEHDNLYSFGKVAPIISTELRKPLVRVRGFIELLKPALDGSGKEHYANIVMDEVKHANNLIYHYLSITKPDLPDIKQVNIQKLIMNIITSMKEDAVNSNCDIRYVKEQILPVLNVDIQQITQVVVNIIKNAMEAIHESSNRGKGSIIIKSKQTKKTIQIFIQDNGGGMDKETIKRLFTPFFTTKEKGTGLGMAVCLKIIQNHGGIIEAFSNLGEGTTIMIVLPIEA